MPTRVKKRRAPKQTSRVQQPNLNSFRLTHPQRVVYPDCGITKGELADYYVEIAEWILPHVAGRPLVLVRCPDGIEGACFFQKNVPPGMPSTVEHISIRETTKTTTYAVVHDLAGLIALIQFGAMEIHDWAVAADDLEHPDRMIFDLDPGRCVPWKQVTAAARTLREHLENVNLTSFVKTSGGKGLHVVVPLAPRRVWSEVVQYSRSMADTLVAQEPTKYIAKMSKAAREGKIFVDYLRNQRGATAVVNYSSRARAGAPVATPIAWAELGKIKSPQQFTVANLQTRLRKLRRDPWEGFAKVRQALR
jgi:bifunctional non-homologous end joining protein LigD